MIVNFGGILQLIEPGQIHPGARFELRRRDQPPVGAPRQAVNVDAAFLRQREKFAPAASLVDLDPATSRGGSDQAAVVVERDCGGVVYAACNRRYSSDGQSHAGN